MILSVFDSLTFHTIKTGWKTKISDLSFTLSHPTANADETWEMW